MTGATLKNGRSRGEKHSEATKRGLGASRMRALLGPEDLHRLVRNAIATPPMRPHVVESHAEGAGWTSALGGEEVSPQRRSLLADAARLGVLLRAILQRVVQGDLDACDAASVLATLANTRRANLAAAGLDWRKEEHDLLDSYRDMWRERDVAARQAARGAPIADAIDAEVEDVADRSAARDGATEGAQ